MKTFSKIFVATLLFLWMIPLASMALTATSTTNNPDSTSNNPDSTSNLNIPVSLKNPFSVGDDLFEIMEALINKVVLPIGGVLCVLGFIYAGFVYVTAQGNSSKIATAHNALLYSAVGTAILLGAWVIAGVIRNTIDQLLN